MELPSDNLEINTDENNNKKETIQNIIPFWSENPNVLLNNEFMFEFFPVENMSFEQKLNAISRTVILLTMMTFLYTKSIRILIIGGISLFFIFMLHKSKKVEKDEINKKKEGFYQSDDSDSPADPFKNADLTNVFREPDSANPFGNVLVTDYIYDPKRKPAPPAFNQKVNDDIVEKAKEVVRNANPDQPDITEKLFQDLGDQYVFEQSLRPFHTTASTTIPNDQQSFSEFCYGSMVSCKEGNAFACAKNNAGKYNLY
jgi:hypothetical protein